MDLIITTQENLQQIVRDAVKEVINVQPPKQAEPKQNLSFREGLEFLNECGFKISKSQLYKRTMLDTVPCKHFGKKVIFNPIELLTWAENKTKRKGANPIVDYYSKK